MMNNNLNELQQQLNKVQEQLDEYKTQEEKTKYPTVDTLCFFLGGDDKGYIKRPCIWKGHSHERDFYDAGLILLNESNIERRAAQFNAICLIEKYIRDNGAEVKPEHWKNDEMVKYYLCYDHSEGAFCVSYLIECQDFAIYSLSKAVLQQAIDKYSDLLKVAMGVE